MFQRLTKKAFSGSTISTFGDQNVNHVSILIDCSPQVVALASDLNEQFIDVPDVPKSSPLPSQSAGIGRSKLPTPVSDRLVGDQDSSLRKQVFYVSKAQRKPMVEPNSVADDFWRETVASIL